MALLPKTPRSRAAARPRDFKALPRSLRKGNFGKDQFINMTMDEIRGLFWTPQAIDSAIDKAAFRANNRAAAYLRTQARNSMKWRPRLKTIAGVQRYYGKRAAKKLERRREHWQKNQGQGLKEPKFPFPVSPPGSPPFARKGEPRTGLIRRLLFSTVVRETRNAFIGPLKLQGMVKGAPPLHEYGGYSTVMTKRRKPVVARFPKRPFMIPARDKTIPKMPMFWKDQVRKR